MDDCVFCQIIARKIPANIVYETEDLIAFNDINPQAPVHVLIVPKKHYWTINDIDDFSLYGKVFEVAKHLVEERGIKDSGYRVVVNCNRDGGQVVFHVHFHLLGGRQLLAHLG
jgi:histidine triad (HIT) family protein